MAVAGKPRSWKRTEVIRRLRESATPDIEDILTRFQITFSVLRRWAKEDGIEIEPPQDIALTSIRKHLRERMPKSFYGTIFGHTRRKS